MTNYFRVSWQVMTGYGEMLWDGCNVDSSDDYFLFQHFQMFLSMFDRTGDVTLHQESSAEKNAYLVDLEKEVCHLMHFLVWYVMQYGHLGFWLAEIFSPWFSKVQFMKSLYGPHRLHCML